MVLTPALHVSCCSAVRPSLLRGVVVPAGHGSGGTHPHPGPGLCPAAARTQHQVQGLQHRSVCGSGDSFESGIHHSRFLPLLPCAHGPSQLCRTHVIYCNVLDFFVSGKSGDMHHLTSAVCRAELPVAALFLKEYLWGRVSEGNKVSLVPSPGCFRADDSLRPLSHNHLPADVAAGFWRLL